MVFFFFSFTLQPVGAFLCLAQYVVTGILSCVLKQEKIRYFSQLLSAKKLYLYFVLKLL